MYTRLAVALLVPASFVSAWGLPFSNLWANGDARAQAPLAAPGSVNSEPEPSTPRIAIIGAGAAGSSAAFFISKAKERFGLDIEVDIYERNDYVGGRSTTVHPYEDLTLEPVELGASIFVSANKNMMRASDEFNLTRVKFEPDANEQMGIWNGEEFLLTQGTQGNGMLGSWFDSAKILWRYGYNSPVKTQKIVKSLISRFTGLYAPNPPRWTNVSSVVQELGWDEQITQTGAEYFASQSVGEKFVHELVGAATRVNYAQNVGEIHALEAIVSLAATGATAIEGGNWRVFEQFVKRSGARLLLNTKVTSVKKADDSWLLTSSAGTRRYNAIILAAPAPLADLDLPGEPLTPVKYVNLHTTLFATSSPHAVASYFGLKEGSHVPETILTAKGSAEFNSMTYHGRIKDLEGVPLEPPQWVVKIFSMERVEDSWLDAQFGEGRVHWIHRKLWQPYPVLPPSTVFPSMKLDDGFYYVNAFELAISTMETETIAARNIVEMALREQFGLAGLCPYVPKVGETVAEAKDFVYGWDCPSPTPGGAAPTEL